MNPRLPALLSALIIAAAASAETVQLPYLSGDSNGNQWNVYGGNVQQQGNQPIFAQAGMITVNGQQPQQNNQQANFDSKTDTLTINFTSRTPLHQTRMIKFDENSGIVRIIDVLENSQASDMSANITLMTSVQFGVTDAANITDPKNKDADLGWAANTGANRAAMSLFAGKGSKVLPTVRYRQGNNQVIAQMTVKVPAKSKAAIVHWHGTFDTADAATQWVQQLHENKEISDIPPELKKAIVNIGGGGSDFIGGREMLRGGANDVIELVGGDQMRGDLKPTGYTLATAYGTIKLPIEKIAGLLSVGGYQPRQLLVTTDGEIFGGGLQETTLPLQLASGQTTAVPFSQIARVGVRTPAVAGGGDPVPWKLDQPMAFLTSGERCRIELPTTPIDIVTRYGPLKLTAAQIALVLMPPDAESQTVFLSDGSRLSGVVGEQQWPLKLVSVQQDAPVQFPVASLARVQFAALDDKIGVGLPTVALLGSDMVSAKITGALKLVTPFDTLKIDASQVRSIIRPEVGQPDVQIMMFDQSTFRGRLETPTLSLQLVAGPSIDVPVAAVRDYQNPRPFPSQSIVDQASAGVKLLNDDDWKQREQAEAQLIGLGESIIPVLQDAQTGQPPEAKERLAAIIAKLKKDQPPATSRLLPPPPLN